MSEKLEPTPLEEKFRDHVLQEMEALLDKNPFVRAKIKDFEEIYLEISVCSGMISIVNPSQLKETKERLAEIKNEARRQGMPKRQRSFAHIYGENLAESFQKS